MYARPRIGRVVGDSWGDRARELTSLIPLPAPVCLFCLEPARPITRRPRTRTPRAPPATRAFSAHVMSSPDRRPRKSARSSPSTTSSPIPASNASTSGLHVFELHPTLATTLVPYLTLVDVVRFRLTRKGVRDLVRCGVRVAVRVAVRARVCAPGSVLLTPRTSASSLPCRSSTTRARPRSRSRGSRSMRTRRARAASSGAAGARTSRR